MGESLQNQNAGDNNERSNKREEVIELLRHSVIPEIVIHGSKFLAKDKSEGLGFKPDIDARGALYLLDLAGIDYNQLTIVPKGKSVKGAVMIDTGERNFNGIEPDGSVFLDHHAKERGAPSSATKIVYDLLLEGGLLPRENWLSELVKLITQVDDESYFMTRDQLNDKWWCSFYGLHNVLSFNSLVALIKDGRRADHVFDAKEADDIMVTDKQGKEQVLFDLCLKQRDFLDKNVEYIKKIATGRNAEERQNNLDSRGIKKAEKDLGAVLTNIVSDKNMISLGYTVVRGFGFDSYIIWWEKSGGFFVTSRLNLEPVFKKLSSQFPEAKLIRGTMIICQPKGQESDNKETKYPADKFLNLLNLKD